MSTEATTSAISELETGADKKATLISKTVNLPLVPLLIAVFGFGLAAGVLVTSYTRGPEFNQVSPVIERAADIDQCGITNDVAETDAAFDAWTSAIKAIDKVSIEKREKPIQDAYSAYQVYQEKAAHLALIVRACSKAKGGL